MMIVMLAFSILTSQAQARPADPAADLAAVRQLYSAASFEEALARLSRAKLSEPLQDQGDTYRALCLLALGRSAEAERVVEQLLRRNPAYLPDEADVSPKLVQVFRAVRTRVLPETARGLYNAARANYDKNNFDLASKQMGELLMAIGNANEGSLADLKLLAEGFQKLANAAKANASSTGGGTPPAPASAPAAPKGPIFSILDRDVVAPVEISRLVPTMTTPKGTQARLYQGLMEVIIDENGRVESATVRRPIDPTFDKELLAAATKWRFQPATRGAKPVKYRRAYEIIGHSR